MCLSRSVSSAVTNGRQGNRPGPAAASLPSCLPPPPLEPVRVGGPAPTAATVLPPSGQSSGLPEERQCPGGKPCRWAQRVTLAPSCRGGAAAEPEGHEGAGVGMSRKWRRQQLDSGEVLGASRAVSCCLRQPPSLLGRERRKARWRGGQEQSQSPEGLPWHGQARRRAPQGPAGQRELALLPRSCVAFPVPAGVPRNGRWEGRLCGVSCENTSGNSEFLTVKN